VVDCDALAIFSLLNNSAVTKPEDLYGKKLGCGYLFSGTTYYQGFQLLLNHGIHIFRDLAQVRFYGADYESYYQAVLRGELDVGFATSSWITKNHPKDVDLLRILDKKDGLSYEGVQYPSMASSLTTTYGLVVSDKITWELKRKILDALQQLNSTNAAMKALKLAGWTSSSTYAGALTAMQHSGVAYESDGKSICREPFKRADIFDSISCPDGYDKVDYNTSARQCDLAGQPCPAGAICFCKPCIKKPQNLFRWETVLGLCAGLYGAGLFYLALRPMREKAEEFMSLRRGGGGRRRGFRDERDQDQDAGDGALGWRGRSGKGRTPSPRGRAESDDE